MHLDWCLTLSLLLFSESKAQSKWEVCCCLWRWGIHYIHCFGMEKQIIWFCLGVCLVFRWGIRCKRKHIESQNIQQKFPGCASLLVTLSFYSLSENTKVMTTKLNNFVKRMAKLVPANDLLL